MLYWLFCRIQGASTQAQNWCLTPISVPFQKGSQAWTWLMLGTVHGKTPTDSWRTHDRLISLMSRPGKNSVCCVGIGRTLESSDLCNTYYCYFQVSPSLPFQPGLVRDRNSMPWGCLSQHALLGLQVLREGMQAWFPDASGKMLKAAPCMFTYTPDHNFIVDRHPLHKQVRLLAVTNQKRTAIEVCSKNYPGALLAPIRR